MTLPIRAYLAFGVATLGAAAVVAASPPVASAEGQLGGDGTGTVTGPTGTTTATGQLTGTENVPGGLLGPVREPQTCLSACSGSLAASTSIVTGPGTPPPTGPQITGPTITGPTITQPKDSNGTGGLQGIIACVGSTCTGGMGTLSGTGSVQTPIVSVSGGLNGFIHG